MLVATIAGILAQLAEVFKSMQQNIQQYFYVYITTLVNDFRFSFDNANAIPSKPFPTVNSWVQCL